MSEKDSGATPSPSEQAATHDLLTTSREDAAARINALQRDFDDIVEASAGQSTDDEHDPEGATIAFERAQVAALLDQARSHLADVDGALGRLAAGTYGACERCGHAIGTERLTARPTARTCIRCASAPTRKTRE